ncbi:MAG: STAS domain-containing protein [Treponema sp.]|nr:STAS domain-containing protein [Treponema sp.]
MEITKNQHGTIIDIMVSGRLDTNTAPQLETAIRESAKDNKTMNLDLSGVEYMSSTGLRDILLAHKIMVSNNGKLIIKNPSAFCMQVLEATNMDKLLTIER